MKVCEPVGDLGERSYCVPKHRGKLVLDRSNPLPIGREYVVGYHSHHATPGLHYWRGDMYRYNGAHYVPADIAMIRSGIYGMLENAVVRRIKTNTDGDREDIYLPFKPKKYDVDQALDAVRALVAQDASIEAPVWINESGRTDASEYAACRNGLLHLPTQTLTAPNPNYFSLSGLGVAFRKVAPIPETWNKFLYDLFDDDEDAKQSLQELFGYMLASDTKFQKIFLIVGPKRSGKGTIARILGELLGRANVAGPTLNSLGQPFGLQSLIGKPLAIISDARLSGRADQAAIAERLLSVSGEDSLSIPRKHQTDWIGPLPTRFMILTNELPRLEDASGALASRFVVWNLERTFFGHEDHNLTAKLTAEMPAILIWALEGYRRLYERGRFVQPQSGQEAIDELETLGSPVGAFVRDRCVAEPGASIVCRAMYKAWRAWCEAEGRDHPGTAASFGRNLRANVAGLATKQMQVNGVRDRWFVGIRLKTVREYG
ncbi:MAG: phage/plasmid primase, P4 family [Planctomycetota bacterium]